MLASRISVRSLREYVPSDVDVLLCCASFEERSVTISQALPPEGFRSAEVFFNDEYRDSARSSLLSLQEHWGAKYKQRTLSTANPLKTADALMDVLEDAVRHVKRPGVLFDATAFTREALAILLKALYAKRDKLGRVCGAYSVAETMAEDWLSRGITEIRPVLGFSGLPTPSRKLHLALLTGFEVERARAIIEEYEPDIISIGCGSSDSSISHDFHKRNERFVTELEYLYGSAVERFEFSLLDPEETMKDLRSHLAKFPEYNTVLAPMNNKVSTIGVALLGLAQQEYQICYAQAAVYNETHYSTPSDDAIFMEIDWSLVSG